MFSCTYNGWGDAPEDEREALDAYDDAVTRMELVHPPESAMLAPADDPDSLLAPRALRHAA